MRSTPNPRHRHSTYFSDECLKCPDRPTPHLEPRGYDETQSTRPPRTRGYGDRSEQTQSRGRSGNGTATLSVANSTTLDVDNDSLASKSQPRSGTVAESTLNFSERDGNGSEQGGDTTTVSYAGSVGSRTSRSGASQTMATVGVRSVGASQSIGGSVDDTISQTVGFSSKGGSMSVSRAGGSSNRSEDSYNSFSTSRSGRSGRNSRVDTTTLRLTTQGTGSAAGGGSGSMSFDDDDDGSQSNTHTSAMSPKQIDVAMSVGRRYGGGGSSGAGSTGGNSSATMGFEGTQSVGGDSTAYTRSRITSAATSRRSTVDSTSAPASRGSTVDFTSAATSRRSTVDSTNAPVSRRGTVDSTIGSVGGRSSQPSRRSSRSHGSRSRSSSTTTRGTGTCERVHWGLLLNAGDVCLLTRR